MPKATKREQDEYVLPEGEYFPAVLNTVEEKQIEFYRKDKAGNRTNEQSTFTKWVWEFEITSGPHAGLRAWGETTAEYTTREDNLVRQWGETMLGRELEVGEDFDTDAIVGLPCMIAIRHEEPRKKKDGTMFYGCPVDEVLPKSGFEDQPPF